MLFGLDGEIPSLVESIEAIYIVESGKVRFIDEEISRRIDIWTAVYKEYNLLGWYIFGSNVNENHIEMHLKISQFTKCDPFLLLINSDFKSNMDDLPLNLFKLENINGSYSFLQIPFSIVSSEVEKISLDTITKSMPRLDETNLEIQNSELLNSIHILSQKIEKIIQILEDMQNNKIPFNYKLVRIAAKIVQSLSKQPAFSIDDEDYRNEFSFTLISNYLSLVNKVRKSIKQTHEAYVVSFPSR